MLTVLCTAPRFVEQVKASRCLTKYHWRSPADAAAGGGGGVQIVATQVRSSGLWASADGCLCAVTRPQSRLRCCGCSQVYRHRPRLPPSPVPDHRIPPNTPTHPTLASAQVVSDYLTAFDDPAAMMEAQGRPVVVYTYRMAFRRSQAAAAAG